MLAVYVGSLAFGVVIVALSVMGSHDTGDGTNLDHHIELDGNPNHDSPIEGALETVLSAGNMAGHATQAVSDAPSAFWLLASFRFWAFGLFSFGLIGVLLQCLGVPLDALWSTLGGLTIGGVAAVAFRRLREETVTSPTTFQHLAGQTAVVVVAVRQGQRGRVAVVSLAGRTELPAITSDEDPIPAGHSVHIRSLRGGVAVVSRTS